MQKRKMKPKQIRTLIFFDVAKTNQEQLKKMENFSETPF